MVRKARLIGSSPLAVVLIQVFLDPGSTAETATIVLLAERGLLLSIEW